MIRVQDVLDGVWQACGRTEEQEALNWMNDKLLENNRLVFDNEKEARDWALENTDLVEPEEET